MMSGTVFVGTIAVFLLISYVSYELSENKARYDMTDSFYIGCKSIVILAYYEFMHTFERWHYFPYVLFVIPVAFVLFVVKIVVMIISYTIAYPFIRKR